MPRGASVTAEVVCLLRALEQGRAPSERIIDDPLAARMLGPAWAWAASPPLPQLLAALDSLAGPTRGLHPGPTWPEAWALPLAPLQMLHYVAARHRFIDDALLAALAAGATEVVLLGAGLDTRAWRLAPALAGRPVWELDFPATQALKRARLAQGRPPLDPAAARFVPVDFVREDFGERMVAAGFPVGAPTVWIWEGVSMYLDRAAVEATLATIHRLGGPGSTLVADFWAEPDGHPLWRLAHRLGARTFGAIGEPLRFQLPAGEAPPLLAAHGFTLRDLAQGSTLAARYAMRRRPVFAPLYVVSATAAPRHKPVGVEGATG